MNGQTDKEDMNCRQGMPSEMASLLTRMAVVESNQEFFKESIVTRLTALADNETAVNNNIGRMTRALSSVPKDIAEQVSKCQGEMLAHLEEAYAKKSEVVTAASLRNTLLLVAVVVTLLGTGINWLLEETVLKYRMELNQERGIHSQSYTPNSGAGNESGRQTCGLPITFI